MKSSSRALFATTVAVSLLLSACGGGSSSSDGASDAGSDCTPAHPDLETIKEGTLTVSIYVTPPYTMEKDGSYSGVDTDIIRKVAELECLEVDLKAVAAAGLIQSIQSKRADTGLGGIYRTAERAEILELPATAYKDGMAILGTEELATLDAMQDKKIGSIQGYLWTEDFQQALGSDNVTIYQASDGMVNDLQNGRIQGAVLTTTEAAFRVQQNPDAGLVAADFQAAPEIEASTQPGEVVFPVPKGNTALATAFSADIQALQADGTIEDILTSYNLPESTVVKP